MRRIVWCTMAAVDPRGRPRAPIVHPRREGPTAWVTIRPGSPKTRHLAARPGASLLHRDPAQEIVTAESAARVEEDRAERARVWEAIASEDPPHGFDPAPIFTEAPGSAAFCILRLDARRIELACAPGATGPAVWRLPR